MNAEGSDRNGILSEPIKRSKGRGKQVLRREHINALHCFLLLLKSCNLT